MPVAAMVFLYEAELPPPVQLLLLPENRSDNN